MTKNEQKEAELLSQFLQPERLARLDSVLNTRTNSLTVVLDDVKNSHNISAVLRSADAFRLSRVHLVGKKFHYSPSISQGTERWMQLTKHDSAEQAIAELKQQGFKLVVLQPKEHSEREGKKAYPVSMLPFEEKLALVFGNEGLGVEDAFQQAADFHAYIPMYGFVESLNISVACAICLFSSTIAKADPALRAKPLEATERDVLQHTWLKTGVRNSDIILREIETRENEE